MSTEAKLIELVGKDLSRFTIVEMTEVFKIDDDGRKASSVGFFRNPDVAAAFVEDLASAAWHNTKPVLVLTDGTIGFTIEKQEPVKLFDDAAEAQRLRTQAIAKFSRAQRQLLGHM